MIKQAHQRSVGY